MPPPHPAGARVLVTGSSGFVGANLTPELAAAGFEIRASPARLSANDLPIGLFDGVSAVVHLAGLAHKKRRRPEELEETNVRLTRSLADAAKRAGVPRFIFLSSVKAMGESTPAGAKWDERTACAPEDEYGRSKLRAEQALREVELGGGPATTILRLPLVYGPGQKANMLELFKAATRDRLLPFGAVENSRSLLYVGNLSSAVIAVLQAPAKRGQLFLLSDGEDVSTPELIRRVALSLKKQPRLLSVPPVLLRLGALAVGRPGMARRLLDSLAVESGRIRSELGWRPRYSMAEGLRRTAEWYLATSRRD